MYWILLSILSSTSIFILFKLIEKQKGAILPVIVINYLIAGSLGFFVAEKVPSLTTMVQTNWFMMAVIIGILFIIMFYFIGLSAQKAGMAPTSVASKMSVLIPITFSILMYNESVTVAKIAGIAIALPAIVLTSWKTDKKKGGLLTLILPLILFLGLGIGDTMVKYCQQELITPDLASVFTSSVFAISFICGVLALAVRPVMAKPLGNLKTWIYGLLLGFVNFGSIFFLIQALNKSEMDSSVVFGVNNIGIVGLSVLLGLILFREKLNWLNIAGIIISFAAIYLLVVS
jgi:multidrug transporter EmrE-like cation transporter